MPSIDCSRERFNNQNLCMEQLHEGSKRVSPPESFQVRRLLDIETALVAIRVKMEYHHERQKPVNFSEDVLRKIAEIVCSCHNVHKYTEKPQSLRLTRAELVILGYLVQAIGQSVTVHRIISNSGYKEHTIMAAVSKLRHFGIPVAIDIGVLSLSKAGQ